MIWKLILLTGISVAGLWMLGYGPAELSRAAGDLSDANASAISPSGGGDSGWG